MSEHHSRGVSVGQYLGFSNMGGAEVYAALIANMHAERGHPSHVIVRTEPGPITPRFANDVNVSYLNFTRDSIRQPVAFLRSLFRGYSLLRNSIKNHEIQILHTPPS